MRVTNYQIICAMEIKILVKENEKAELDKFIETCKEHGMELTREGGGKLPNFSGYYAEFKGVRWQKDDTDKRQSNIPDVKASALEKLKIAKKALNDIYNFDRDMEFEYGDPGERAMRALEAIDRIDGF